MTGEEKKGVCFVLSLSSPHSTLFVYFSLSIILFYSGGAFFFF